MPDLYVKDGDTFRRIIGEGPSSLILDGAPSIPLAELERDVRGMFLSFRSELGSGLWLSRVIPGCSSLTLVSKIAEQPAEPHDYAAIMSSQDALANFIVTFFEDWNKNNAGYGPSAFTIAGAVLNELARLSKAAPGQVRDAKTSTERRLEPDL